MRNKRNYVHISVLALFMFALALPLYGCQSGGTGDLGMTITQYYNEVREWFTMNGANDRIEKIRKGDAVITVVDDAGVPVRQARIYYEQQSHDFLFGSTMTPLAKNGPNAVNQDWADAYVALFNYGTLPCYWDSYEPKQGQSGESVLLAMADWAGKRGIVTKGHPLVWANAMPVWAPPAVDDMQQTLEKRVKDLAGKFCGVINYWDVVNEPTMGPRVNNPLGNWMNARTPAVACVDSLDWARTACPRATLIINDYRTDTDFKAILQDIVRQKSRFDAIGIQSHMHRGNWPLWQVWDICDRFQDFNVPIHFTEVTILSGAPRTGIGSATQPADWPSTAAGELAQAKYAGEFYRLLFSHPAVEAITWWDFSDLEAWQDAPAGLLRKDMTKKPAYNVLLKMIRDEWWSRGSVYTDDNGVARVRGFYGQYKVQAEKENIRLEGDLSITKGMDNQLKLQLKGYKQKPPTPLWEQVWPYLLAVVILAIIVLIGIQIDKAKRRI